MSRIGTIAIQQMAQDVLKRGFLITLLSLPLFVAFTIGLGFLFENLAQTTTRLGYVDPAGVVVELPSPPPKVLITRYETTAAARAALDGDQIDAYYALGPDYAVSRQAELVFRTYPPADAARYFESAVRQNLLVGRSPEVSARALAGAKISARALSSGRMYPTAEPTAGMFAPLIAALFVGFLIMTLSSTLLEALVKEEENRTMEVIVSSVSPGQMMAGKIIGGLGVTMVLLLVWLLVFVAAVGVGARVLDIAWLQNLNISWRDIGLLTMAALPAILCITALMTVLGATMIEVQEAQQIGPLLFMVLLLPIYFIVPLVEHPHSAFAITATLFPLTSVTTLGLRSLTGVVPTWHYIAATLVGWGCGVGLVWLAGKAFRLSMLRYGQRLRLRELWRAS